MALNSHFSHCRKKTLGQNEDNKELVFFVSSFALTLYVTLFVGERGYMMYGVLVCYNPHPLLLSFPCLFHHSGCCILVSGSMRAEEEGQTPGPPVILHILLTLFYPLFCLFPASASIASSSHLLGSRNYLSPCKGASSIP